MIDRGKHNLLGVMVNAVDYEAAVDKIATAATEHRPLAVSALAVHGLMTGATDDVHRHRLNQFDLIVPDGQPVRWALNRIHHTALEDRVYGPTLMLKTCERAAQDKIPIFLLGADQPMLDRLTKALIAKFPNLIIAGTRPSKFRRIDETEKQELIDEIRDSGAQILFVGLGCPRQEIFVYEFVQPLRMPMLAVGAAYAFHAGVLPQAPKWMQDRGLEWLFRLTKEPRRLWRRYVILNPLYVALVLLQWLKIRIPDANATTAPTTECLYG